MLASEIVVGQHYIGKVNNRLRVVKVLALLEGTCNGKGKRWSVLNIATGMKTIFRSAARFRRVAGPSDGVYTREEHRGEAGRKEDELERRLEQLNGSAAGIPCTPGAPRGPGVNRRQLSMGVQTGYWGDEVDPFRGV